jgi:hypothetical protein
MRGSQENPFVQDHLWKMRDKTRDEYDETCSFVTNNVDGILSTFNLKFEVQGGTEKLNKLQKMAISLLMHQESPISNDGNSFHAHRSFVFSHTTGMYLDGVRVAILQKRSFRIKSGYGTSAHDFVEEVDPIQPVPTGDIVVAVEVAFDAKGSSACNESIWFDPPFSSQSGGDVNVVHSTPFVSLQPVDNANEGYDLINRIMEDYVAHNGSIGQDSSELLEKFTCMKNFYSNLAWPKTKTPTVESETALKPLADHVNSPYFCEPGCKIEPIWKSFSLNLASLFDDETPDDECNKRMTAFTQISRSSDSLPPPPLPKLKDTENIADFLSDYLGM